MMTITAELNDWENILVEHETELKNIVIDADSMDCYEIDKAIERKLFLEQLIQEDNEIIKDIKRELFALNK